MIVPSSDSANKLCINEDLSAIETALGAPLSVNTLMTKLTTGLTSTVAALPNSTICSACNKAAYTIIKTDFGSLIDSDIDNTVKSECGADFVSEYIIQSGRSHEATVVSKYVTR
jgi:hypothetical protein